MVRILIITHISPPAIDGGSHVIHKLGDYYKSKGFEVASLSSDASSTDDFTHSYHRHCEECNDEATSKSQPITTKFPLPVYTFLHRPLKLISKLFPFFSIFSKGPIFKLLPFFKFLLFYLKFKPNYIIAGPLPTTVVLYAHFFRFVSKLFTPNTKLLINASFHHTDKDFHHHLLVRSLKSADFIWTLTDFETKYFNKKFGIPISKMINVGNGIDSSLLIKNLKFKIKNSYNLLYIGSFAAHKGIETIINSFTRLPKSSTLTLAGQPTLYSPIIENKISSLPKEISSRIKIYYKFNSNDLKLLLDQSTVLVSASSQESFGLVLLEAMARGIPVIGANIPATTELINKSGAGLIFKTDNSRDLTQNITKLHKKKSFYNLCSRNGLSYASCHTWDRIGELLWQRISFS